MSVLLHCNMQHADVQPASHPEEAQPAPHPADKQPAPPPPPAAEWPAPLQQLNSILSSSS